jgi:hypothetical protein
MMLKGPGLGGMERHKGRQSLFVLSHCKKNEEITEKSEDKNTAY